MTFIKNLVDLKTPILIAGPCSAETEMQVLETANQLKDKGVTIFRAGIWKPRTHPGNFEGVGSLGLSWLKKVKKSTGMLVATEVATPVHVALALKAGIDILWIGARTTANPFATEAISEALKGSDVTVMVKNPLNPDLEAWIGAIERLQKNGIKHIVAVHRGFSMARESNYRNSPEWRVPIELRRRMPEIPIITDPSHISGRRDLVETVSRQAVEMGFDGLMIESHCCPDEAWSDASQQITPSRLYEIISKLEFRKTTNSGNELNALRSQIDAIDSQLIGLLAERMQLSAKIGEYKKKNGLQVVQLDRYDSLMSDRIHEAELQGLKRDFMQAIFQKIHEESVKQQL